VQRVPLAVCLCAALLLFTVRAALCRDAAQALQDFKTAYARATEADAKGDREVALPAWKEALAALDEFGENDKILPFKETVIFKLAETQAWLGAAAGDPAAVEEARVALDGLLKRKKLVGLKKDDVLFRLGHTLGQKSRVLARRGENRQAVAAGKEGLAILEKLPASPELDETLARDNSQLGLALLATSDLKAAEERLTRAAEFWGKIGNEPEQLRERNLIIFLHGELGRLTQAEREYEALLAQLPAKGLDKSVLGVECRVNLGLIQLQLGKYADAAARFDQAEALAREVPDYANPEAIANNRGIVAFREGMYHEALGRFDRAGQGRNAQVKAQSLANAGGVYLNLYQSERNDDHFTRAEEKLRAALTQAESVDDARAGFVAGNNLGRLYLLRAGKPASSAQGSEDCAKALDTLGKYFREANDLAGRTKSVLYESASLALNLGDVYLLIGTSFRDAGLERGGPCADPDPLVCAEKFYREGLDLALRLGSAEEIWYGRYGLARVWRARGNAPKAIEHYAAAIENIESLRNLLSGGAAVSFLHDKHMVYTECIDLLLQEWEKSKDPKAKQKASLTALEYLERSRQGELRALFAQALPEARQKEHHELAGLRYRLTLLAQAPEPDRKEMEAVQKAMAPLEKALEKDDPMLQKTGLDLAACQRRLGPDQAVLEYYYSADAFYVWKIDRAGVSLHTAPRLEEDVATDEKQDFLETAVDKFGNNIVGGGGAASQRTTHVITTLHDIYKRLFVDAGLALDPTITRLTIVPYRRLSIVPFAALYVDAAAGSVLLDKYQIGYLTALSQLLARPETSAPVLYAVGNPNMPQQVAAVSVTRGDAQAGVGLSRVDLELLRIAGMDPADPTRSGASVNFAQLPDAGHEVETISSVFAAHGDANVAATVNQAVPPRRVLDDLSSRPYAFLHFATHGKLIGSAPLLSFLAFSQDPEATDPALRKGYLTVKTIRERLFGKLGQTRLCVLSCCQTALASKVEGLEYASLAGAFQSAGVETIIATLWEVPSRETATLVATFYEQLFAPDNPRKSYTRAMQLAQERVRRENSDPFYWAAFIVIGPDN